MEPPSPTGQRDKNVLKPGASMIDLTHIKKKKSGEKESRPTYISFLYSASALRFKRLTVKLSFYLLQLLSRPIKQQAAPARKS